ncbi:GTPase Der [Anaplasma phagocytophilum]|uniref:ribosome biogenesis GTPase Der n=1 Tax=Anaplasma phagocytophilum TaxID=948 RepID=UPI0007E063BE|nr:ribosome biogenesis GTPase Der [Anaplasma phagocytophilum]SCV64124.1 GTPase Der [Anaplasma phagocytophilum]
MQKVAIVGLPNVGKSTLFNRLTRRKSAIVSDIAHVTRDRKEALVDFCGLRFIAIDTGGVADGGEIQSLVKTQVQLALENADVVLFVIDAQRVTDVHSTSLGKWLSKITNKPIILVANKCESNKNNVHVDTMEYLGFLGPVYISAEHNLGMADLYEAIAPLIEQSERPKKDQDRPIAISIIGQPNVGKSTFVNSILGEERVITSGIAGTTRDSISTEYSYKGITLLLTDTAGIRKRTKVTENMEKLSVQSAIHALSKSHVVILIVDFTQGISQQDLSIASTAIKDGKGIVLALNKADLVNDKAAEDAILNAIRQYSRVDFDVPIMKMSALENIGCDKVISKAVKIYESASTHISTSKLNKWLGTAIDYHPPHLQNKKKVRLKYISQVSTLPPTFVIATNSTEVESTYQTYLKNSFLKHFSMQGVPIRMIFKKGNNPYISKD